MEPMNYDTATATDGDVRLNREYYADKVIPSVGAIPEHGQTVGTYKEEKTLLQCVDMVQSQPDLTAKYRFYRCDRMMRFSAKHDIWSEEYRILYIYDRALKVWRFHSHFEGLNKLPR